MQSKSFNQTTTYHFPSNVNEPVEDTIALDAALGLAINLGVIMTACTLFGGIAFAIYVLKLMVLYTVAIFIVLSLLAVSGVLAKFAFSTLKKLAQKFLRK